MVFVYISAWAFSKILYYGVHFLMHRSFAKQICPWLILGTETCYFTFEYLWICPVSESSMLFVSSVIFNLICPQIILTFWSSLKNYKCMPLIFIFTSFKCWEFKKMWYILLELEPHKCTESNSHSFKMFFKSGILWTVLFTISVRLIFGYFSCAILYFST
jgi:hypothetical protein